MNILLVGCAAREHITVREQGVSLLTTTTRAAIIRLLWSPSMA